MSENNWNPGNEKVGHSAKGHAYKARSTYPLTAAMTDTSKPQSNFVEGQARNPGPRTAEGPAPVDLQPGAPKPSMDGTVVTSEKNDVTQNEKLSRRASHKPELNSNTTAKLANPLGDLTDAEVIRNATEFAQANNLPVEWLQKGAVLAKRPWKFEEIKQLDEADRQRLRDERDHPYRQPKILYNLVSACSLAAAVQGMDESVISGAQLFYPKQFGIAYAITGRMRDSWLEGLVNGAPYLCSAVIGCWLTRPLNFYLGRRWTIFVTAFAAFATCIWSACTNTWWHLFIARFFLGFGIGPKSSTVPIFAAECAPARIRGGLVMQWQMWTAFGIMLGYVMDLAFYSVPQHLPHITGLNWRLMLGSAGFPALIVMAQVLFLPESPRWLMTKGRYEEAYNAMLRLRGHPLLASRDLYYTFVLLEEEASIVRGRSLFLELFTIGRNRRASIGASLVMFGQQFCGVNAIVYYTATIFTNAGLSNTSALLASWGFGMLNFLFAIPAIFTIDRYGRRPLLLTTFPLMSLLLLFTGFCFWIPGDKARTGLVALGIYLYVIVYSPGEGPVPFTYSAEAFPLYLRELGMSLATTVCWGFNFIVSLTFPALLQAFKPQGAFGWYAAWCAILAVLILFFLPETKSFTLEELDQVFSVPTGVHARYQAYNASWYFRRYILRHSDPHEELYKFETEDISEDDLEAQKMARSMAAAGH